jgi:Protein of unknown function (DUF3800)
VVAVSTLYLDESGSRHPDFVARELPAHGRDWFGMGGVLIQDEDLPEAKAQIRAFRQAWPQIGDAPLHSHEIRSQRQSFAWLREGAVAQAFLGEMTTLLLNLPVIGFACVIDRPGYNARYERLYQENRWQLCKTAFAIAVERAAKHALQHERRLRVYVEASGKTEDRMLRSYYDELRVKGPWFDGTRSSLYSPLTGQDYAQCLYEFRVKQKKSLLMTIADLYLWPMCMGGYDEANRAYVALKAAGKLIDCHLSADEAEQRGIKYSCFDAVKNV